MGKGGLSLAVKRGAYSAWGGDGFVLFVCIYWSLIVSFSCRTGRLFFCGWMFFLGFLVPFLGIYGKGWVVDGHKTYGYSAGMAYRGF